MPASESQGLPPRSAESYVARYSFNIYDGVTIMDDEGTEFRNWEDARLEAIRLCGETLKDHPKRTAIGEDWRMEVTDKWGLVLFRLDFSVVEAPAVKDVFRSARPPQV